MVQTEESFRPNAVQSPWSAKPAPAAKTEVSGAFTFDDHGADYYSRSVPDRFSGEGDDRLMNSLISRYSLEGNVGGKPNGHFYLNKEGALAVSKEVVNTHLGMNGKKREQYIAPRFNQIWSHFDVNSDGFLEVERMPQFLRMLVGEVEASFGLQ